MDTTSGPAPAYRVLARKYRPRRLSELVGQEAMVRTLRHAFESGRIAHAFLLAGIRGVGKTTTARIIARGLNCTGPDGAGGPTTEPCGVCESCRAIEEERSLDVIETDAASHTGKDDVQEIVEGVRYAPAASRFKVYIFDEVHMLSEKAWNALLKTVEEPPPHVKFIFATTEIRRVPVTVLSRCQRFDLRRVESDRLVAHLEGICAKEGIEAEREALALIARAAEGSVRDALSLLDQAAVAGEGRVRLADVEEMLALADRGRLFDLFEAIQGGDAGRALDVFDSLWRGGVDPAALLRDLLDLLHALTRLRLERGGEVGPAFGPALARRAAEMAARIDHPRLQRYWQMTLRGLEEVRLAPDSRTACEMLLVRLCCVRDLPPPGELAELLRSGRVPTMPAPHAAPTAPVRDPAPVGIAAPAPSRPPRPEPVRGPEARAARPDPREMDDVLAIVREAGDLPLAAWIHRSARLVRLEPGRLELAPAPATPPEFLGRLGEILTRATGRRWMVAFTRGEGAPTLAEREAEEKARRLEEVKREPLVRRALELFPGARVVDLRRSDDGTEDAE